ncbi:hypothetical protein GCM10027318_31640 [Massilia agilis]
MNLKRLRKAFATPGRPSSAGLSCISSLDRSIPTLRTVLIIAGIVGAALDVDVTADYLFAAGLLLHFTIWFEDWWRAARAN